MFGICVTRHLKPVAVQVNFPLIHYNLIYRNQRTPAASSNPWLKKVGYRPDSSSFEIIKGPGSNILVIKCRTEELSLWIEPQDFSMDFQLILL